jgi:hypothetical protein
MTNFSAKKILTLRLLDYNIHKTASGQEYVKKPNSIHKPPAMPVVADFISPADTELPADKFRNFAKRSFEILRSSSSPP